MKALRAERGCAAHRVARAFDVGETLFLGASLEVVDRGDMEEMADAALQARQVGLGHTEVGLGQVAGHGRQPGALAREAVPEFLESCFGAGAHEHIHRSFAREQSFDEVAADEARAAGDESVHEIRSSVSGRRKGGVANCRASWGGVPSAERTMALTAAPLGSLRCVLSGETSPQHRARRGRPGSDWPAPRCPRSRTTRRTTGAGCPAGRAPHARPWGGS